MLLLPLAFFLHSLVASTDAALALITDSPWLASIWHTKKVAPLAEPEIRCTGSIIAHSVILTSARCLLAEKTPVDVWVAVGVEDLLNKTGTAWYPARELRIHPSYSQSGINTWDWRHDVGLVFIFASLEYGPTIQPISTSVALAAPTIEVEVQAFGIIFPGWINGRTELLSKKMRIESVQTCQERSEHIYSFLTNLAPSQMCVIDVDKNVKDCPQNVGGPVTSCGVLVGIVSWMSGSCYHNIAGILFTDVSWYNKWIFDTVEQVLGRWQYAG